MTQRFLVVQTAFIGDVILTTPLLTRLAQRGVVDVVTTPVGATLLDGHPAVRHVVAYDKRQGGMNEQWRVLRAVRAGGDISAAYLAQGSSRSGLLAWATGADTRIGFSTSAGQWTYTKRLSLPADTAPMHHAERLWRLDAGGDAVAASDDIRPRLYPPQSAIDEANAWLARAGWRGEPLIALAPGSVWGTKRWPHYAQLSQLIAHLGRAVVIGAHEDRDLGREITTAGGGVLDMTGKLSLAASAALLSRCAAIVTNDSAPLHMASAVNTPTVAIFGPTWPAFGYGPLAERAVVLEESGLACRPCHTHGPMVCPLVHHRCMRDLSAERVASSLTVLLGATS